MPEKVRRKDIGRKQWMFLVYLTKDVIKDNFWFIQYFLKLLVVDLTYIIPAKIMMFCVYAFVCTVCFVVKNCRLTRCFTLKDSFPGDTLWGFQNRIQSVN